MYGISAAPRAWDSRPRIESTPDPDSIQLPDQLVAAVELRVVRVLPADSLERNTAERVTHLAGRAKPPGRTHPPVNFGLNSGRLW